jgi:glucosamine 6-phosphate synthetase-like amidotransferase/phosphosugar isomerase protein
MNHTHYALINEDNDVVAVIRRSNLDDKLQVAIEEETGDKVLMYELSETDYHNYKAIVILESDIHYKYTYILRPTWEY